MIKELVVELFEFLVGNLGDLDVEGALGEAGVAIPPGAGLLAEGAVPTASVEKSSSPHGPDVFCNRFVGV